MPTVLPFKTLSHLLNELQVPSITYNYLSERKCVTGNDIAYKLTK